MAQQIVQPKHNAQATPRLTADQMIELFGSAGRYVALLAAWTAMSGSLFFSEALGWLPCVLCWYQRILMYPLAIIIAVGMLRRDDRLHLYVLPLSLFGACVSLYHYLLVKTDWLPPPPCVAGIPCTVEYLNVFGFINIPFLALTAFLIISFTMVASALSSPAADQADLAEGATANGVSPRARWSFANAAVFGIIAGVVAAFVVAARYV